MAQERLRWGSLVLLSLALASWVLALGGLAATNWMVCSDTQATRSSIATSEGIRAVAAYLQLSVPAVNTDVAYCSRSWRWEWWTLFFEFAVLTYGLVVTLLPSRIARARYAVAQYLVIATVLVMVALNDTISDVWFFWDKKRLFNQWSGAMQKLYLSASALAAGWVLICIFNFIWIGFALDFKVKDTQQAAAPPTQTDEEAPQAPKK